MNLSYPLGLLGLIAIPILILIYIIKNKYTEKTVSSTYLWTLSERFLKRRLPISKLSGIISLILQILAVVFISLAIAHPIFIIPESAQDYCFILDASGSMNILRESDGKSRFELAKDEIRSRIDGAMSGSTFTLIYAGSSADTVLDGMTDKEKAIEALDGLTPSYEATPLTRALETAQGYFDENPAVRTYLVTDKEYLGTENINLVWIKTEGDNYGVSGVDYTSVTDTVTVTGNVYSYINDATLTVDIYFDGAEEPYATQEIATPVLTETPFEFVCENMLEFKSVRVEIRNTDILPLDNVAMLYNVAYENASKTLLVSDSPALLRFGLLASKRTRLDIVSTKGFEDPANSEDILGHDLFIFDSYVPAKMPEEGAVWFVNPKASLAGSNFNYQGEQIPQELATFSVSTSTVVRNLLKGMQRNSFTLVRYGSCGLSGKFNTLISCDGRPLVFAGANTYGNREVVIAFDVHDTDFALTLDYPTLLANLLDYSFPAVVEETFYYCGDMMQVNMVVGSNSVKITAPSGKETYPDMSSSVTEFELEEVGSYTVTMVMNDKTERVFNVYSALPEGERAPVVQEQFCMLQGTPDNRKTDGTYDSLLIMFIVLAVLAVADYGVYCYEQYQLR